MRVFGFKAYDSAQEKACTCIPDDYKTMSRPTQLIKPKKNEIDAEQSKSIFQNIYDNFSKFFSKVIDILISSPIVQSARSITSIFTPVIDFFRVMCVRYFGCTPLKSDAGLFDIIKFLKTCYANAHATLVRTQGLIG